MPALTRLATCLLLAAGLLVLLPACPGACGPPAPPAPPPYPRYERAPEGRVYKVILGADQQEQQTLLDMGTDEELQALRQVWPYDYSEILNDRKLAELLVADCDDHLTYTYGLEFYPDGSALAGAGLQGVIVFEVPSLEERWRRFDISTCWAVDVDPQGRWVVAGRPNVGTVVVLDSNTGAEITRFEADTNGVDYKGQKTSKGSNDDVVEDLRFSPDGSRLLVTTERDHHVWIYRTSDWTLERTLNEAHPHELSMADFTPDGRRVVVADGTQVFRVYDLETGEGEEQVVEGVVRAYGFHWIDPDRFLFACALPKPENNGSRLAVYDWAVRRVQEDTGFCALWSSVFKAHGGRGVFVDGGSSGEIRFRDLADFQDLWNADLGGTVSALCIAPGGDLAAASAGGAYLVLLRTPDPNDSRWKKGGSK